MLQLLVFIVGFDVITRSLTLFASTENDDGEHEPIYSGAVRFFAMVTIAVVVLCMMLSFAVGL